MSLTILKPSFWTSDREIRDDSNAVVGTYRFSNIWYTKAEGEAMGRKYFFGYKGWDNRYNSMSDASGNEIARSEPVGWWGVWYKLVYRGKEYTWCMNGWGTSFMLFDGKTEIMRVYTGGYFKPGTVTMHRPMETAESVPLVLYALYQQHIVSSNAAAASGGGGGSVS